VSYIRVYLWGAGAAGFGAYVEGLLPVVSGELLSVMVGQGGCTGCGCKRTRTGGGAGAGCYGGGGGGRSAIRRGFEDIVTAGAAGGGSYNLAGGCATSYMYGAIQTVSYRGSSNIQSTNCSNSGGGGGALTRGGSSCNGIGYPNTFGRKYQGGDGSDYGNGGAGGGGGGYYFIRVLFF
jgi:hypothetical protein